MLPENHFLEEVFHANEGEMQRKHRVEKSQSHQIQQDTYPKVELYRKVEVLESINCSSIEMKTANNPRHAFEDAYEA